MKLLPINKDIPATHWQCQCRGIALIQRDAVFEKNRQIIQDAYELKTFSYDIEKNYWKIQSAEWISSDESRVNAKRKIIHTIRREGIKDELKHMIEDELNITVESFQDYFIE